MFLVFLDLAVLFLQLFIFFYYSISAWLIFLCQIPLLNLDCLFLLFIRVFNSFLFFANSLMPMCIRWLIFTSVNLNTPCAFSLYDINAITNNHGKSAPPLKIPLRIFSFAKVFPSAVNSTLQFSIASMMNYITLLDILFIFDSLPSRTVRPYHRPFYSQPTPRLHFSVSVYSPWEYVLITCFSYSLVTSFLFFRKQSAAY